MEQKATMGVFWEHDGKSELAFGDKGGVCFLITEDGVRVVANYKASLLETAHLFDSIQRYIIEKYGNNEELFKAMQAISAFNHSRDVEEED